MKHRNDPVAELMQEHNEILSELKKLNKVTNLFSTLGYSSKNFQQMKRILVFIGQEVGAHNRKEEEALFPVLDRYVVGPTRIMRVDHKKLKKSYADLCRAVDAVRTHQDSFLAIRRLRKTSQKLIQLFVNHIHKENFILFPMIQRFLKKEELQEIARRMLSHE